MIAEDNEKSIKKGSATLEKVRFKKSSKMCQFRNNVKKKRNRNIVSSANNCKIYYLGFGASCDKIEAVLEKILSWYE